MAATAEKPCTCKHESQDKIYGAGRRLHNIGGKGVSRSMKCTVCGKKS